MLTRIITTTLILLIAVVLQIIIGEIFGFWINFALAALVSAAFFLGFLELLLLALFAVFALSWQPTFSYELLFVAGFAFLVFAMREVFPWHRWLSCAFFIFLGIAAMYAIFAPSIFLAGMELFLADALGATLFGIGAFKVLKSYDDRQL